MDLLEQRQLRDQCKDSFVHFVKHFWDNVPGTQALKWSWHMEVMCRELESVANRVFQGLPKVCDTVINISPGTSKSSLCSILFPAWVWSRMPEARIMTASHTADLVLDLANKSRHVIQSEEYRKLFPYVQIESTQNSKSYFRNTKGGDRYTCTVAGRSPMGFHAHIQICLPGDTEITTDQGNLPINKIVEGKIPAKILGYCTYTDSFQWQTITSFQKNPGALLWKIRFHDDYFLEATEDHPILTKQKGYIPVRQLNLEDEVCSFDYFNNDLARLKCTTKIIRSILPSYTPEHVYNLTTMENHNYFANRVLVHNCDDPLDPKKAVSEAEIKNAKDFFDAVLPGRMVDKTITPLFLVMQRLHEDDPTGHLLEKSKRDGAMPVRHICLPAEITDELSRSAVSPQELIRHYSEDGLMDPIRLPKSVLNQRKADGLYAYCTPGFSPITLPNGIQKPIESIQIHDEVLGYVPCFDYSFIPVVSKVIAISKSTQNVVKLTTSNNQEIYCTSDHKWWTGLSLSKIAPKFMSSHHVPMYAPVRLGSNLFSVGNASISLQECKYQNNNALINNVINCEVLKVIGDVELMGEMEVYGLTTTTGNYVVWDCLSQNSGQYLQSPVPPGGGMFKASWFTNRVKSAPYQARRVLYVDRAFCLVPGTLITMQNNTKTPIEQVKTGDKVLTRDGYKPVLKSWQSGTSSELTSVWFGNGSLVTGTPNHLVWTENRGWVGLRSLVFGDTVCCTSGSTTSVALVTTVKTSESIPVYDLEIEDSHEFFANDILVHNSTKKDSCNTAITLMAEHEGSFYVGPVWVGKWEPDERDTIILLAAQQCRDRFGPRFEPTIVIEQEPAAGVDSYRHLARKLAGFTVYPDPVRANKELRADPWASQCASQNVRIVEDGNWDIAGFVDEHCHFPFGRFCDRVDSSSGSFNWLTKNTRKNIASQFHILTSKNKAKKDVLRIVACTPSQLAITVLDEPSLIVYVKEPDLPEEQKVESVGSKRFGKFFGKKNMLVRQDKKLIPQIGNDKLLDHVIVCFADLEAADLQQIWDQLLEPYGKYPADLLMKKEHAKQIWGMITRKRTQQPGSILVCGEGNIGLSLALGICDGLHLKREETVSLLGLSDIFSRDSPAPNKHVFQQVKDGRFLVV